MIKMAKDLLANIVEAEKEIEVKEGRRVFSTKALTVTGEMKVKIPGRPTYEHVESLAVCYEQPIEVDIQGYIAEVKEGLNIEKGRMQVTAYRKNPTEIALDNRTKDIVMRDPEIVLYQDGKKIILNQAIGTPVITITSGLLTYK